jgi:trk system potassium uptake protein
MQLTTIQRILGLLMMVFSTTMLPPVLVSWWYDDGAMTPFLIGFALVLVAGFLFWLPVRGMRRELRVRDGFVVVVMFWSVLGLVGALPFYLSEQPMMSFTDAVFESMSGLTTTGATVLVGLDHLPPSILFYRQELQWLGGMGIVVLAVAVMPMLGVGGMQLFRAETPGPMKDNKLTPRITETAKALWNIYLSLTIACALAYWLAGMSGFDAIAHSFSTVAIGGFSTHDASMGVALRRRSVGYYWRDPEVRLYLGILVVIAAIVYAILVSNPDASAIPLRDSIFQAVSIATTTGFTTADFSVWPVAAPALLLFAAFAGGCAGSTAGGLKVVRVLLIYRQGVREMKRLIHPTGVFTIKLGANRVSDRIVDAVWGFFALYIIVFLSLVLLMLMIAPVDFLTAFSAVAACLNNLGPGLGSVALNYAGLPETALWLLMLAMVLGRLEIFTLLVLFMPAFWRR